jgi:hypothetical protein
MSISHDVGIEQDGYSCLSISDEDLRFRNAVVVSLEPEVETFILYFLPFSLYRCERRGLGLFF